MFMKEKILSLIVSVEVCSWNQRSSKFFSVIPFAEYFHELMTVVLRSSETKEVENNEEVTQFTFIVEFV